MSIARFIQDTSFLSTAALENTQPAWPWYSSSYINSTSLPQGAALGQLWCLDGDLRIGGGNWFMWVKATGALAVGSAVKWSVPGTDTAAAGTTATTLNLTTGGLTANAEIDNWVFVAATGGSEFHRIKANTATTITVSLADPFAATKPNDPDVFVNVPVATNPVSIIRPWQVVATGATTDQPIGVALGTVSSGNYTIIQVAGLAMVLAVGSTTATVVGQPMIPTATAGTLAGIAAASTGSAIQAITATPFIAKYATSAAAAVIPAYINALGG